MKLELDNMQVTEEKPPKTLVVKNNLKCAVCLPPQSGDLSEFLPKEEEGKFLLPGENTVSVALWKRLTEERKNKGVTIALRTGSLELVRVGEAYPMNLSWASRPLPEFEAFISQVRAVDKIVDIKNELDGNKKLIDICEKRIDQILDEASKITVNV